MTIAFAPLIIAGLALLAAASLRHPVFKRFSFTVWVFTFVAASMFYPGAFGRWFGHDLRILIVPLIQIITFGMGTTLSARDFGRIFAMPWPVLIGMFLQYSIMPLVGFGIANLFGFEPEIGAGIVLIGCVPGGVASNLINYLAGANVALSVSMTAVSTMISPIMTPFWMKVLAGRMVPVNFGAMMFSIINMIIVPVAAGLVANKILYGERRRAGDALRLAYGGTACLLLAIGVVPLRLGFLGPFAQLKGGLIVGLGLIGLVALAKLMMTHVWKRTDDWMDRALPIVSMAAICLIIAVITARSRDQLLTSGLLLILAAVIHNNLGYLLGYWGSRAFGMSKTDAFTVAIEVGMQNGGMASGIAMEVLKSVKTALAPAIFGPWMNISGSVLASWWRRRNRSN